MNGLGRIKYNLDEFMANYGRPSATSSPDLPESESTGTQLNLDWMIDARDMSHALAWLSQSLGSISSV